MTSVDIPPFVNIIVAAWICILTITLGYYAIIKGSKWMDLGEKEELVLCGKETKPRYGKY
jgi:hypothetical protein